MSHNEYSQQKFYDESQKCWKQKLYEDICLRAVEEIPLICFKCEKQYMGIDGNCCCGACCSYCNEDEDVLIDGPIYSKYQDDYITDKFGAEYDWTFEKESWATVFHKVIFSDGKETTNGVWVGLREEEDEDVCCVGCGDRICGFHEEPDHKDDMDEAVCNDCY